ncbi:hypothetical protein KKB43_00990 [Patescibacteria group bacterium]|nr:hypothetical protein [Patescibacteria group bacterium]MBU4579573.1 hypothetical protein [Patescibacteria group bacterium]
MPEKLEQIELKEFIRNTIEEIEGGIEIGKRHLNGTMDFEVSISKTQKIEGGIKIYVASGEKEISKEQIAKIKFSVYPNYPRRNPVIKDDLEKINPAI